MNSLCHFVREYPVHTKCIIEIFENIKKFSEITGPYTKFKGLYVCNKNLKINPNPKFFIVKILLGALYQIIQKSLQWQRVKIFWFRGNMKPPDNHVLIRIFS